jgi:hypothetical protein
MAGCAPRRRSSEVQIDRVCQRFPYPWGWLITTAIRGPRSSLFHLNRIAQEKSSPNALTVFPRVRSPAERHRVVMEEQFLEGHAEAARAAGVADREANAMGANSPDSTIA